MFFAQRLPRAPKAQAWVNHGLEYLNHGLEHGNIEKKPSQIFFWVRFLLSKKVYVMFLRVLEVFLGCFTRSACREHPEGASMGLNHGLEHGKWKKIGQQLILLGSDFLFKKVHVMFTF